MGHNPCGHKSQACAMSGKGLPRRPKGISRKDNHGLRSKVNLLLTGMDNPLSLLMSD